MNQAAHHVLSFLNRPDRDVKLLLADSVWARQGVNLSPEFLETCGICYDAEASTLDFTAPEAIETINHWISKETGDRMPGIVEQIDPSDVMFLANAIYFQGTWTKQFSRKLTQDEEFLLPDGTVKMHPMMRTKREEELNYLDEGSFKAVELPYGEMEKLSMYVFLPREMDAFLSDLSPGNWNAWMGRFQEGEGMVIMPKFKLKYGKRLNEILGELGMEMAFGPGANFSRMVDDNWLQGMVYLAYVDHRAVVEVDERGTEAAGVSLVAARWLGGAFHMKVDSPFFFVIRDNPSGAILFMGLVEDPRLE